MTSVSVVVPAYNEGVAFAGVLATLADYFALHRSCGYEFRYVIVDDGSTDDTYSVARAFARWHENVLLLRHPQNCGLGAALRTAFQRVDTDLAVVLDADLSYSPATAMELIEALERENADIALASPYMRGGSVVNVPPLRRLLSREANRILSLATSGRIATLTCMVRAFRVRSLEQLSFEGDRMEAVPELLLCALRSKMTVVEIPATLQWSAERRLGGGRVRLSRLASQTWATLRLAFRHRPALWLAVPGLFPGLLPLVAAILLLLHVSPFTFAVGTAITVIVQYTSLAIFGGQLATFVARRVRRRHIPPNGVATNDYERPKRTA